MSHDFSQTQTFHDVIRYWAQKKPDQLAFSFLDDGETPTDSLTFGELDQRARAIAVVLRSRGLAGQPVLLQYRSGLDFVTAFFGCLYGGVIAVSAYPPTSNRSKSDRLQKLVQGCDARAVLTNGITLNDLKKAEANGNALGLPLLCTDAVDPAEAESFRDPGSNRDSIAFLQYSSGSTGDPKGVIVSHGNILHNQALIKQGMATGDHTVFVSWLPLFHDMGLIGNVMQPLYLGVPCYLMPPIAFVQKPVRWLNAISRYRGTCTGGPNFAYDLCVAKVNEADRAGLDLSSWEVAYNGAEPVRAATLRRFVNAYAPYGLSARSIYPCYGLAEATLFVSGPRAGSSSGVLTVDAEELQKGAAQLVESGHPKAREIVSCGRIWGDQTVLIVDPATQRECEDGVTGEIWLQGESITRGYWLRPDADREAFAQLSNAPERGTLFRTGDLGFMRDGELYVTGRLKEILIVRGRNHYPHDIEHSVQQSWAGFVGGGGAAFLTGEEGEEQLVVVQEIARTALSSYDHRQALECARKAVAHVHGLTLAELVPIRPATLAKTSSGKIRRSFMRQAHQAQKLDRVTSPTANV